MSAVRPKHTCEEGPSIWAGVNIDSAGPRCKEGIISRPVPFLSPRTRVTNASCANSGASVSTG